MKTDQTSLKWNKSLLVFLHLLPLFLVASLFSEQVKWIWRPLDEASFRFFNSWIAETALWQNFWAMANHRFADWVEDVIFLLFFFWIIRTTPKQLRSYKTAECLFIVIYCALTIILVNEALFRLTLYIERKSPTLILDSFTYLPEKIKWLKIKAKSTRSFPGDHATTAIFSIISFAFLARKRLWIQLVCISYGIFLTLPRMITGAHWLTDVLFGSGSIVMIASAWAFCTPLASICIGKIHRILLRSHKILFPKPLLDNNTQN